MQSIPRPKSLVAETVKVLLEGVAHGRWKIHLPGERQLSREFQVSRWTLRAALKALGKQGVIRIKRGLPCEISKNARHRFAGHRVGRVAVIMPAPIYQMTTFSSIWLNEFRSVIQKMGVEVNFFDRPRLFKSNPRKSLEDFVRQNPHSCWILLLSTRAMQRWFSARGLQAIVAGSLHENVNLASQDTHFRAVGRHATGAMIALGHRRIALLAAKVSAAGVAPGISELEHGVHEACVGSRNALCEVSVIHYDDRPQDVCRALDRLIALPDPPTALLMAHSSGLLTAVTHLSQRQVAIPRDLSIVAVQDESYFRHIVPELTHYEWSPVAVAARMVRLVKHALEGTLSPQAAVRFVPRFVPGKTLVPPPRRP